MIDFQTSRAKIKTTLRQTLGKSASVRPAMARTSCGDIVIITGVGAKFGMRCSERLKGGG